MFHGVGREPTKKHRKLAACAATVAALSRVEGQGLVMNVFSCTLPSNLMENCRPLKQWVTVSVTDLNRPPWESIITQML